MASPSAAASRLLAPAPQTAMTVRRLLQEGVLRLKRAGPSARHEAEWLLSRLVGVTPLELYMEEISIPEPIVEHFFSHIEARTSGTPLQYLLGETEFFGERFAVRPDVFIPRPETEVIVEAALQALRSCATQATRVLRLLDLGTGSGCIAVTLARRLPSCVVVGVEVSWKALCVARDNVLRHGLSSRVRLVQGRWLDAIGGLVDGIVSNPPYIPSAQVGRLPLDVRQEPCMSLDGGADGMRELSGLITEAPRVLRPGGIMALECGEEHVSDLVRQAASTHWVQRVIPLHDLAGRPRGLLMTRHEPGG